MSIGKDDKNQIWFQSDQFLTNVTLAKEFYVKKRWFAEKWKLFASFHTKKWDNWSNHYYVVSSNKLVGTYKSEIEATMALGQARKAMGIKLIEKSYLDLEEYNEKL